MGIRRRDLGELLLEQGVAAERLAELGQQAQKAQLPVAEAAQRMEGLSQLAVARALSRQTGLPVMETVDPERVDIELVRRLPLGLAREKGVLPLWEDGGRRMLAP